MDDPSWRDAGELADVDESQHLRCSDMMRPPGRGPDGGILQPQREAATDVIMRGHYDDTVTIGRAFVAIQAAPEDQLPGGMSSQSRRTRATMSLEQITVDEPEGAVDEAPRDNDLGTAQLEIAECAATEDHDASTISRFPAPIRLTTTEP